MLNKIIGGFQKECLDIIRVIYRVMSRLCRGSNLDFRASAA